MRKQAKALLLLNRESQRAKASLANLEQERKESKSETKLISIACDLMSFEDVRKAAANVNDTCQEYGGLDVLANNAGIMSFPDNRTKDGYDVQMQTNHLSHFLLTKLVLPSFELALQEGKEVRICQHSSKARDRMGDLEAKYFETPPVGGLGGNAFSKKFERYHQTKLANTCFALMLHKKLQEKGYDVSKIKSVVAEPGIAGTDLGANLVGASNSTCLKLFSGLGTCLLKNVVGVQSAADGALPLIHACFAEAVDSGDFFYPEHIRTGKPLKALSKGQLQQAAKSDEKLTLNVDNHELLWAKSEEACGVFFE